MSNMRVWSTDEPPPGLFAPDVYFTASYGALDHSGEWILLEAEEGRWQIPLIVRSIQTGSFDAVSPYGYSGVYLHESLRTSDVAGLWTASLNALKDMGVVSVFLRRSPLVNQAPLHASEKIIVADHATIMLDLRQSEEQLWDALAGRVRTAVRKAHKSGLIASYSPARPKDISEGSDFRRLYNQTMRRNSAGEEYFFNSEYYEDLQKSLGPNLWIGIIRNNADEVVSAALFLRHDNILHYHLSGSTTDGARLGANNLLLWGAACYASKNDVDVFHLGGGISNGDSLWKFKSSHGGTTKMFRGTGIVVDEEVYNDLSECHALELGLERNELASAYFPAYRAGHESP